MPAYDLQALMSRIANKRAELEAKSGKNNVLKPPPGFSRWRVLPGWRKADPVTFSHEFAQHWIKDAAGNVDGRVYVCEREVYGRECDICDLLREIFNGLKAQGITKDSKHPLWKTVSEWNAKTVHRVNVLCTDGANKNLTKPVLMALPSSAFEAFLALWEGRVADGIDMLDPQTGRDIRIERVGSGFDTKYSVQDVAVSTAVDPQAMENLINIDAFIAAELDRGKKKGTANAITTIKAVLTGSPAPVSAARSLIPSKAALVPGIAASTPAQNRVIEEGEAPPWEPPGQVIEATPAPAPAAPAPAAVAPPVAAPRWFPRRGAGRRAPSRASARQYRRGRLCAA